MCEGVGEDSRHGFEHVVIQVGSCIFLSVIVCHDMCTWVGSNPCRKLSLLGIAHPVEGSLFQVHGVYRRTTLTRGRICRRKSGCGFGIRFVEHVLKL